MCVAGGGGREVVASGKRSHLPHNAVLQHIASAVDGLETAAQRDRVLVVGLDLDQQSVKPQLQILYRHTHGHDTPTRLSAQTHKHPR